jgi:hypothetical protein
MGVVSDQFHDPASLLQMNNALLLDSRLCGLLSGIEIHVIQPIVTSEVPTHT